MCMKNTFGGLGSARKAASRAASRSTSSPFSVSTWGRLAGAQNPRLRNYWTVLAGISPIRAIKSVSCNACTSRLLTGAAAPSKQEDVDPAGCVKVAGSVNAFIGITKRTLGVEKFFAAAAVALEGRSPFYPRNEWLRMAQARAVPRWLARVILRDQVAKGRVILRSQWLLALSCRDHVIRRGQWLGPVMPGGRVILRGQWLGPVMPGSRHPTRAQVMRREDL